MARIPTPPSPASVKMTAPNPSHSRSSSVASVLAATRGFLRTQLWVWPLVAALVLVFLGVWLRVKMEGATKQQIADTLQTILNANTEALRSWSITMKSDAENPRTTTACANSSPALFNRQNPPRRSRRRC